MSTVTGSEIGDLIREWERQHNRRLTERQWSAAWRAANRSRRFGKVATRAAIHSTLTR